MLVVSHTNLRMHFPKDVLHRARPGLLIATLTLLSAATPTNFLLHTGMYATLRGGGAGAAAVRIGEQLTLRDRSNFACSKSARFIAHVLSAGSSQEPSSWGASFMLTSVSAAVTTSELCIHRLPGCYTVSATKTAECRLTTSRIPLFHGGACRGSC